MFSLPCMNWCYFWASKIYHFLLVLWLSARWDVWISSHYEFEPCRGDSWVFKWREVGRMNLISTGLRTAPQSALEDFSVTKSCSYYGYKKSWSYLWFVELVVNPKCFSAMLTDCVNFEQTFVAMQLCGFVHFEGGVYLVVVVCISNSGSVRTIP